jgi:hypothetical protein
MRPEEAAELIDALRQSFQSNPSQFTFTVNVKTIGTQSIVHGGGTGISVNVTGGAGGSRTTGYSSSASAGTTSVQIAQGAANAEIERQAQLIITALGELSSELRAKKPERSVIDRCLGSLATTFAPAVIVVAVKTALKLSGVEV